MKIVHIADTHLGFSAYRRISEAGYNQREEDINNAFKSAIDKIIEIKPDLVLHAGDLFDSVRPTNRILHFAIEQILRLTQNGITVIMISGNHDTPKQRYIGSVFKIFEILPTNGFLKVIFNNEYTPIKIGDVLVHAIPQCTADEIFKKQLKRVAPEESSKNVLMLHAGVTGMKEFSRGDFNELLVDSKYFEEKKFDYVALGHYHRHINVGRNAYFPGSTERLSFNEVDGFKGFIEVDLSGNPTFLKFHEIKTRLMLDFPSINAEGKDSLVLSEEIEKTIRESDPKDKIIRLKVINIPQHILSTLDIKKFRELAGAALHFEPVLEKLREERKIEETTIATGGMKEEFISFMKNYPNLKPAEVNYFTKFGVESLEEAMKET